MAQMIVLPIAGVTTSAAFLFVWSLCRACARADRAVADHTLEVAASDH